MKENIYLHENENRSGALRTLLSLFARLLRAIWHIVKELPGSSSINL